MNEDRQLLEAIARAVGVTLTVNVKAVCPVTVGKVYMLHRATRARGRAWQMERNLLRPFVVRFWRRAVASVGPEEWQAHRVARRRSRTRLGRAPCELTLNLELAAAKRLVPGLRKVRPVKTRTRRESWFTEDQIDQLLVGAAGLRWRHQQLAFRALVAAMAATGLRISEALSLRWDRLTLRGTTSVTGKGAKARIVAFTARALAQLGALERHPGNPHVFANHRTGKVWNASTVRAWFRRAIAAAHLEGVKADGDLALVPHNLRHSAASIADARGAPAQWIQNMLGHAHASTTAVYLHRNEVDAAVRMAAIMGGRRGPQKKTPSREKDLATETAKSLVSFS